MVETTAGRDASSHGSAWEVLRVFLKLGMTFLAFTFPSAALMVAFASGASWFTGSIGEGLLSGLKIVAGAIIAPEASRNKGSACVPEE